MKITLQLSDIQCIGLIRLAARRSMSLEDYLVRLLDIAIYDADFPMVSLEEFLRDPS